MLDTPLALAQTVTWLGPFTFSDDPATNIYQADAAQQPGLYIWTIEHSQEYLPYYVGETTKRTLIERLHQHVLDYLIGNKDIFDAMLFAQGVKQQVWKRPTNRTKRLDMAPLIHNYQHVAGMLTRFRLFIAPLQADERTIRRIESALVTTLTADPQIQQFQSTITHQGRLPTEPAFTVTMIAPSNVHIRGWQNTIQA